MARAGGIAGEQLRNFIERWERIQEEIKGLKEDQKEIMAAAKSSGFDPKIIRLVIARRKLSNEERQELDALVDVYSHAIGMDDTPLGDAARKHLSRKQDDEPTEGEVGEDTPLNDDDEADAKPITPTLKPEDLAAAREAGEKAAKEGIDVLANPYTSGDPRRAAWDEGWCSAIGSDGMDIPAAFGRRSNKKKPAGDGK